MAKVSRQLLFHTLVTGLVVKRVEILPHVEPPWLRLISAKATMKRLVAELQSQQAEDALLADNIVVNLNPLRYGELS